MATLDDTRLRSASINGDFETVQKILTRGKCSEKAKLYAMYNAILYGHADIVKLLLQNGVFPNGNDDAILRVLKLCEHENIIILFEDYLN